MKLSILIPTLNETKRIASLRRLRGVLDPQINGHPVEIRIHDAGRSIPTGQKRNELIKDSEGEYFCFIDDDDLVPEYYVNELMDAIRKQPDVVTFNGYMTTNGKDRRNFTIELGSGYFEKNGHYYRYPNHLCCFRREAVNGVWFDPIWIQEDYKWATKIKDLGLLKSAVHIEKDMYHYDYWTGRRKDGRRR